MITYLQSITILIVYSKCKIQIFFLNSNKKMIFFLYINTNNLSTLNQVNRNNQLTCIMRTSTIADISFRHRKGVLDDSAKNKSAK